MRKQTFALGAAAATWLAAAVPSTPANALPLSAPAGLAADAESTGLMQNVAYVCRYGYYGRVCRWRPGYYGYGYYRPYRAYGYYRPYRPYWGYRRYRW